MKHRKQVAVVLPFDADITVLKPNEPLYGSRYDWIVWPVAEHDISEVETVPYWIDHLRCRLAPDGLLLIARPDSETNT